MPESLFFFFSHVLLDFWPKVYYDNIHVTTHIVRKGGTLWPTEI